MMTITQKIFTGFTAFFMLIPGLAKFTDKFKGFLEVQIANANLPFPELSFIGAQATELLLGITLFTLLFFWNKFDFKMASRISFFANIMVIVMMLVAVYVHLHPNVPAEVLPFEYKPPVLAIVLILMAILNINKSRKAIV